ncbi:molybdopterin-dependent oxidoreductase [Fodinicola acaciae]|uniref:molybdopterin-dependent oxidoreductase n=1 Tax=Fodinicola acaciae TaxID=2681555 RepID=UPI0013D5AA72|nr:molybdopterin-dependent oxidoreductase [Fodinicola acaciae]
MSTRTDQPPADTAAAPHNPWTDWRRPLAAGAGLLTAAAALGVAQLVAVLTGPETAPVTAVGQGVVRIVPEWLKEWAIRTFYIYDKVALIAGTTILLGLFAGLLGLLAIRWLTAACAGVGLFGVVGALAAMTAPNAAQLDMLPSLLGAVVGVVALRLLVPRLLAVTETFDVERAREKVSQVLRMREQERFREDRRRFIIAACATLGVAAVGGGAGQLLGTRTNVTQAIATTRLPKPASAAPPLPAGIDPDIYGLTRFTTPNVNFYKIDTTLVTPQVNPATWQLRIHGMVDRELTISFPQLLARPLIERDITLACVSNEVGGGLVGNARWLGAPLADLLREAGVRPGADQVFTRSVDGWTCGTPTEAIMNTPNAMLAVGMNGVPLPAAHGFPVRMIVPGLYGYVSGTKWIVDLELTTVNAGPQPYWIQREWAAPAPIKTMCRIDVPGDGAALDAGKPVKVAGVAWAQNRGISAVEVRVGKDDWQPARLVPVPGNQTWRQWVFDWTPPARGRFTLFARATDGTGEPQTSQFADPFPSGATGWPSMTVDVS